MAFTKFLSTFAIVLSIFSTAALSLRVDDDTDLEKNSRAHVSLVDECEAKETTPILNIQKQEEDEGGSCSHWGLSHWFFGIGEYAQVMACCEVRKKEGVYKKIFKRTPEDYEMSDCLFDYGVWGDKQNWCKAFFVVPWQQFFIYVPYRVHVVILLKEIRK